MNRAPLNTGFGDPASRFDLTLVPYKISTLDHIWDGDVANESPHLSFHQDFFTDIPSYSPFHLYNDSANNDAWHCNAVDTFQEHSESTLTPQAFAGTPSKQPFAANNRSNLNRASNGDTVNELQKQRQPVPAPQCLAGTPFNRPTEDQQFEMEGNNGHLYLPMENMVQMAPAPDVSGEFQDMMQEPQSNFKSLRESLLPPLTPAVRWQPIRGMYSTLHNPMMRTAPCRWRCTAARERDV